jgi:hypothetical protein
MADADTDSAASKVSVLIAQHPSMGKAKLKT